jgi:hypothetical protein
LQVKNIKSKSQIKTVLKIRLRIVDYYRFFNDKRDIKDIQGVSEIGALILTGNRTHQKEQLFSLPFWRKTLRNGLKK